MDKMTQSCRIELLSENNVSARTFLMSLGIQKCVFLGQQNMLSFATCLVFEN